jgi:hypothetical protein
MPSTRAHSCFRVSRKKKKKKTLKSPTPHTQTPPLFRHPCYPPPWSRLPMSRRLGAGHSYWCESLRGHAGVEQRAARADVPTRGCGPPCSCSSLSTFLSFPSQSTTPDGTVDGTTKEAGGEDTAPRRLTLLGAKGVGGGKVGGKTKGKLGIAIAADAASTTTTTPPWAWAHNASISIAYRTARGWGEAGVPSTLPPPPVNSRGQAAGARASLFLFFWGAVFLPLVAAALALTTLYTRNPATAAAVALIVALGALPPGHKSDWFRNARVWDAWRRHFSLRAVVPPLPYIRPHTRYLVAQFPHATFPMGTLLNAAITDSPEAGMPPCVEGVVADVLLRLPLFKHIFAAKGCHPADGHTLARLLKTKSVAIIPEGVAGIFHGASREAGERVYLSQRRGFLRAALVAGTPVIPVYHLGNSQLLSFVGLPGLSRRLRLSVGLFFGVLGSPYPHRTRMLTVVGDPLEVVQSLDPTRAEVDELHGRLCAALKTLFDGHKGLLGPEWAEKELVIV